MPTIFIPAQLRGLTGGLAKVELPAATVGEAVDLLDGQFPGLRDRLCPAGELIPGLQISINHHFTRAGLSAPLNPDSEVHFVPVIGGG